MPGNLLRTLNKGWSIGKKALLGDELEELIFRHNNTVTSLGLLAIGVGSNTRVLQSNTVEYRLAGIPYNQATAEIAFTATDHDIADGYTNIFLVCLNAAGALSLHIGTAALAGVVPTLAGLPADNVCIGTVQITAVGAIFNAFTDALNAGHLTVVYTDRDGHPAARPSLNRDMLG